MEIDPREVLRFLRNVFIADLIAIAILAIVAAAIFVAGWALTQFLYFMGSVLVSIPAS